MKKVSYTIEDCLELLVGLRGQSKFSIESSDHTILQSIGRQVFKGVALTDRQYDLVKSKLLKYKSQFTALEYDIEDSVKNLRLPLRQINREKYIALYTDSDKQQWIQIRFPFSKKLIVLIESLVKYPSEYKHQKGTHEHLFKFTEKNVFQIVDIFKNKDFKIDDIIIEAYDSLVEINNNKQDYIPGIYNFKFKNLNGNVIDYAISTIGEPSIDNLAIYKDRSSYFGLHHFDQKDLDASSRNLSVLSQKLIHRVKPTVLINPEKYTILNVTDSLIELDRFPLLVVLTEANALDELCIVHRAVRNVIDIGEETVMFRLENDSHSNFNDYIRENKLNSPIDKNTKIVYISNNKVPKPLVKSMWRPLTTLLMSSVRSNSLVSAFISQSDLSLHYDKEVSQFMRFQKEGIQEL